VRIDLHTHTVASDGVLTPPALVAAAQAAGVGLLAVCDHDSTNGLEAAIAAGPAHRVEVWPGVELSCDTEAGEVHVLGYFVDHHSEWFQTMLARLRDGRTRRAERIVERLHALGAPVSFARVKALANGGAIGRPHIARALIEAGHARTTNDAFDRYIGRHGPAYAERVKVTPAQAVEITRAAGGLSVLAHPGWGVPHETIPQLVEAGLDGIEVYYPEHTPAQIAHYAALARRYGLLMTGGTDFHGGEVSPRGLGSQFVPDDIVPPLRAAAAGRSALEGAPAVVLVAE
jgi:predicted metal-dependent phosphoesterase TrpH